MTTDANGAYLCGECGAATDSEFEWHDIHFCGPTCRDMYATEWAEYQYDWQQESEALSNL